MQGLISGSIGHTQHHRGDVLMRIALRRERFVWLITGLTLWGTNALGLELVTGYSPAKVTVAGSTINGDRKLNEFVGGAKILLGLTPSMSPVGLNIGVGPALIRRGKDVRDPNRSESNFGGVAGAGLRIPFSHGLGLRVDAEDYFYGGDFGGGKDFTNDLVLSVGLHINFGGK